MVYSCQFCNYTTKYRNQIHYHHILPKEKSGSDNDFNRVFCCPNCHSTVFIKDTIGIHSNPNNSIIIDKWFFSTDGRILFYKKDEKEFIEKDKNYLLF